MHKSKKKGLAQTNVRMLSESGARFRQKYFFELHDRNFNMVLAKRQKRRKTTVFSQSYS